MKQATTTSRQQGEAVTLTEVLSQVQLSMNHRKDVFYFGLENAYITQDFWDRPDQELLWEDIIEEAEMAQIPFIHISRIALGSTYLSEWDFDDQVLRCHMYYNDQDLQDPFVKSLSNQPPQTSEEQTRIFLEVPLSRIYLITQKPVHGKERILYRNY